MINYLLSLRAYNVNMWIFSHRKARCMALVLPWRRQQNFPCFELLNLRLRFRDLAVPSLYGVGEGKNHKVKKERRKKQDDESAANIKALRAMFLPSLSRAASLRNLISRKENFLASKCRRFSRRKLSFRKKRAAIRSPTTSPFVGVFTANHPVVVVVERVGAFFIFWLLSFFSHIAVLLSRLCLM